MIIAAARIQIQHSSTNIGHRSAAEWQANQEQQANELLRKLLDGFVIYHSSVISSPNICATDYILVKERNAEHKD